MLNFQYFQFELNPNYTLYIGAETRNCDVVRLKVRVSMFEDNSCLNFHLVSMVL